MSDEIFSMLLEQHENNVPSLLDSFASFLSRKTDFFITSTDRDWETLLVQTFRDAVFDKDVMMKLDAAHAARVFDFDKAKMKNAGVSVAFCNFSDIQITIDEIDYKISRIVAMDSESVDTATNNEELHIIDDEGKCHKVVGVKIAEDEDENETQLTIPVPVQMRGSMSSVYLEVKATSSSSSL